jgi:hypothetical protein
MATLAQFLNNHLLAPFNVRIVRTTTPASAVTKGLEALGELTTLLRRDRQREIVRFRADELAKERYANPKRLLRYGTKVYSQCDEDGIIQEIFQRIGTRSRTFAEFGVQTGVECNTLKLLIENWRGMWIEADKNSADVINANLASYIEAGKLILKCDLVDAGNVNDLLSAAGITGEIDLISIDIDFNDYWVWEAIEVISPRVVVIEYNATWVPPLCVVVPYNPSRGWDGWTNYYGASLEALVRLGARKGYRLVGCSFSGVNAFFVREDLCGEKFLQPGSAEEHYEPPRYFCNPFPGGHAPQAGLLVTV